MASHPTLRTERLVLRPWRDDDADFLLDLQSRWEVVRFLGTHPQVMRTREEALASIAQRRALDHPVHGIWAITTLTEQIPGTHFRVDIDPALRVTDIDRAEILLRCAQEGITNALRHGRAHTIDVRCREVAGRIELTVINDGPPLKAAPFGNGLTGMRERLATAGGALSLQPRTQGGAELLATIPAHG